MKKKGFTLIELLAVIVILAIIAVIAIPIIMGVIEKSREGSLEIVKQNMIRAAELYTMSHEEILGIPEGQNRYIQLADLENGYLKKVKNPGGGESCTGYVKVENRQGILDYIPYLDCGNGQNLLIASSYINYGGNYLDEFYSTIVTSDGGYLTVGRSNSTTFSGNVNKNLNAGVNYDAIIVKYNADGKEIWSKNFGGSGNEIFYSVWETNQGYVAVGTSASTDGDLAGLTPGANNSIVVKYDKNGNVTFKKVLFTNSDNMSAQKVIYRDGHYYIAGQGRGLTSGMALSYIAKYDEQFNRLWWATYGGSNYTTSTGSMIFLDNGNILLSGSTLATDLEVADIKIGPHTNQDSFLYVVSPTDGSIVSKSIFGGNGGEHFHSAVEVEDGYIAVGYSSSNDHHMMGLNQGGNDAIVVKYAKEAINGILQLEWVKTIGGTGSDLARDVLVSNQEIVVLGTSNSINRDFINNSYSVNATTTGYAAKLNMQGELQQIKHFGGTKTDVFLSLLHSNNSLIMTGYTFSTDGLIEPFNQGNSDGVLIAIDMQLELKKQFQLPTLLKAVPKEIVKNYGTEIPTPQNRQALQLYTTNDSTRDLGKWCTSAYIIDNNANYNHVPCLRPFEEVNMKQRAWSLMKLNNSITFSTESIDNWIRLNFEFGNAGNGFGVSNLKLIFEGEQPLTVEESVAAGLLEPLVLVGDIRTGNHFFPNSYEILSGGNTGEGSYPRTHVLIKPKVKKITGLTFQSNKDMTSSIQGGFSVQEFINFDISLTKAD